MHLSQKGVWQVRVYRSRRLWIGLFYACLIFTSSCANQTAKPPTGDFQDLSDSASPQNESERQVAEQKQGDANEPLWLKYGKRDLRKWPKRLIADSKATFLRFDNATALLLAGGASIIMDNDGSDKEIARYFEKHSSLDGFEDESLNVLGHPATHAGATALWYFLSAENDDIDNMQRAWTMRTALTLSFLATSGLKLARNNESPNGKDYAWPSGHTSSSFTVASVLDEFYGPNVGIPAYVAASAVAYRMMDTGDHWGSDVVFGATLGWVVGHSVAGRHKKIGLAGFDIVPYMSSTEESVAGIGFLRQF
jgi:membrane-associated phospholipid phosphatase